MKKYFFILIILTFSNLFISGYTIEDLNNEALWSKNIHGEVTYYIKKHSGKVPILCFHKLNNQLRYGLTPEKFEDFLIYLNENRYFLISDKDFINRDFSSVPTGFIPIVMGSDDASEGNFLYKTIDDNELGEIDLSSGEAVIEDDTMVSLLLKHIKPVNGKINFTFYVSFDAMPFRQYGGKFMKSNFYWGYDILNKKFNYLLDNFYLGNHTLTHPVTKNTSVSDFKLELEKFYNVMHSYVGERVSEIDTLAYPHGCADLKPEMESMIRNFSYKGAVIRGAFDFDGYFSKPPFNKTVRDYDISRIGVDNKNIEKIYWFLENVPLFETTRVIVVKNRDSLEEIDINEDDYILVVKD